MSTNFTLTDSITQISLNPEWDLKYSSAKIETANRTRSGALYKYNFGQWNSAEFTVEFVDSATACTINSWWGANTPLVLYDVNSVAVCSGYLMNDTRPIDHYIQPYIDQFGGTIKLETY